MKFRKTAQTSKQLYEREKKRLVANLDKSYREAKALWREGMRLLKGALKHRAKIFSEDGSDERVYISKHRYVNQINPSYIVVFTVTGHTVRLLRAMVRENMDKLEAMVPPGSQFEFWIESGRRAGPCIYIGGPLK